MQTRIKKISIIILIFTVIVNCLSCGTYHTADADLGSNGNFTLTADAALQAQAQQILTVTCGACHISDAQGGVTDIANPNHLYISGLITPGDPTQGRLILSIEQGDMPIGGFVTALELQVIRDWVTSMQVLPAQ